MSSTTDITEESDEQLKTSHSLLAMAQAEDQQAWQRIVQLYTPLIDYWIRKRGIRNLFDLENTRQDVFTRVSSSLGKFSKDHGGGSFRGWLRRITDNLITNQQRRTNEPFYLNSFSSDFFFENIAVMPEPEQGSIFDSTAGEDPTEKMLLSRQIITWVKENHSERQASIFEMLVIEDRQPIEIAKLLGVKPNIVYQTKSRILARIRRYFGDIV